MCGRFALTDAPEEVAALFGYLDVEDFPPRYNIAPTQPIAIVREEHRERRFTLARWGLVPAWVDDPQRFSLLINARTEGILDKPAFGAAMKYRRCLVPASGFYEWRRQGKSKQPFWVRPERGGPIAFAGLWETWSDRDGGEIDFRVHHHHVGERHRCAHPRPHAGGHCTGKFRALAHRRSRCGERAAEARAR